VLQVAQARQRLILARPITFGSENCDTPLAFFSASDISYDAIDTDGITRFVKSPDRDMALLGFHRE
jgi:hypothetical protein